MYKMNHSKEHQQFQDVFVVNNNEFSSYSILPFIDEHKIPFVFILKKFDEGTIRQISNAVVAGKFDRDLIYCGSISTSKVPNFFQ